MSDQVETEEILVYRNHASGKYTYESEVDSGLSLTLDASQFENFGGAQQLSVTVGVIGEDDAGLQELVDGDEQDEQVLEPNGPDEVTQGDVDGDDGPGNEPLGNQPDNGHDTAGGEFFGDIDQSDENTFGVDQGTKDPPGPLENLDDEDDDDDDDEDGI